MNFIPKSYYISQLLTIDQDWPVPVDKHGSDKHFTPPLDTLGGVKYLNLAITRSVINIFFT